MEASTNSTEATISCSPWPCHIKCGDRIQSRSGIMTILLIVMELGKFTGFCTAGTRYPVLLHYCTAGQTALPPPTAVALRPIDDLTVLLCGIRVATAPPASVGISLCCFQTGCA